MTDIQMILVVMGLIALLLVGIIFALEKTHNMFRNMYKYLLLIQIQGMIQLNEKQTEHVMKAYNRLVELAKKEGKE